MIEHDTRVALDTILPDGETVEQACARLVEQTRPLVVEATILRSRGHEVSGWVLPQEWRPWRGGHPWADMEPIRLWGLPIIWSTDNRYGVFTEVPR